MSARILLVEDDAATRSAVAGNLEAHGFRVTTSEDVAAALRAWDADRPDLILLDLGLPDLDGSAVVRHVRRDATTPILILQAGRERIVSNRAEEVAVRRLPAARLAVFPEARHELLQERDEIRNPVLESIRAFFDEVSPAG